MAAEGSFSTFFVIFGTFFAQVFSTPTTTKHLLGLLSVTRGQKMIFFYCVLWLQVATTCSHATEPH